MTSASWTPWVRRMEDKLKGSPESARVKKPDEKLLSRQHFDTQVPEACGIACSAFHVTYYSKDPVEVGRMYLKLDETWHYFYLDAWALFWREGEQPDWDPDDLLEGEEWVDWGQQLGVIGVAASEITMEDSVLTMRFENGAEIVLRHTFDDVTSLVRFLPGESA